MTAGTAQLDNSTTNQDSIYFKSSSGGYQLACKDGQSNSQDSTEHSYTNGTTLYARLVRSGTSGTLSVYSDSTRNTLVNSSTHTIPASVTGLNTLQHGVDAVIGGTRTISGTISNVRIWNGIITGATWTMEPTLESDFSSSTGWSQQGTEIAINTGTGKLDWIGLRSSTNTGISYDFGAGRISTSKWRLQFDLYIQNFSGTSYTQRLGWMLSTKGSADNSDQLRDFIGGRVTYRGQDPTNYQQFNTIDDQGSTDTWADNVPYQPAQGTDNGVTPVAGTTYNIVLTRDSPTAYTMTISSGGTLLDTLNYTSYAGTSDLRYLLIQRYGDAANAGSSSMVLLII